MGQDKASPGAETLRQAARGDEGIDAEKGVHKARECVGRNVDEIGRKRTYRCGKEG